MADEIIKRLSSIEIGDGEDDDSSSPKTKSLIANGADSKPSLPKTVTTLFQLPSSIDPMEDKSKTESTEMQSVEHADDAQVSVKEDNSESKKMTSVEHGDTTASESSQVSVFSLIDPTELQTDDSPKSSSTSGSVSGSGSPSGSGSGSGSGSDSGTGSASSVESTCSAFCLVLQMTAAEYMDAGRAAAAAAPEENIVHESEPNSMLLNRPNTFIMRAFSEGWNQSVEGLSVLPPTEDDFTSICRLLTTAAYTTGRWFDSYDNSPKTLPASVWFQLFHAWKTAGLSIGRYVLSKYGYEKHMAMEDLRDFFTFGRF